MTNKKTFRLLDMPPVTAAENMALDEALLEAKSRGDAPDTVRFLRFSPPAVLVGFHQSVEDEVRTDFCRANGIQVNRRITGGGAILLDESQIGWELVCDKRFFDFSLPGPKLFQRLCEPVVTALERLGVRACFRPRNDIEVDGRKISGTGGTDSETAFLFHGSLLVDFDVETMLRALRVPVEKLEAKEIESLRQRVTCLKWELGETPSPDAIKQALASGFREHFGIRLEPAGLTNLEKELYQQALGWFRSRAWIDPPRPVSRKAQPLHGACRTDAGLVRFTLAADLPAKRIRQAYITGDFLSFPSRGLYDLEARLRGAPLDLDLLRGIVRSFFDEGRIRIVGMSSDEFMEPLKKALQAGPDT
ncbi:MAG: lipoate--protein ligase family protein [bacterium]